MWFYGLIFTPPPTLLGHRNNQINAKKGIDAEQFVDLYNRLIVRQDLLEIFVAYGTLNQRRFLVSSDAALDHVVVRRSSFSCSCPLMPPTR